MPGTGADFFWQKASALQLSGFVAKPPCARHQGHSQEGEMSHKADDNTLNDYKTDGSFLTWIIFVWPIIPNVNDTGGGGMELLFY